MGVGAGVGEGVGDGVGVGVRTMANGLVAEGVGVLAALPPQAVASVTRQAHRNKSRTKPC